MSAAPKDSDNVAENAEHAGLEEEVVVVGEPGVGHDTSERKPGQEIGTGTFWENRSDLIVPLILAAFSTYLLIGILTMHLEDADQPDGRFFPTLLVIAGYTVSVALVVAMLRTPSVPAEDKDRSYKTYSDWSSLAWVIGGFLVFAIGLPYLGWIIAGAVLYWCVTRAFSSPRPLLDLSIALVMSSLVYIAFAKLLGLNLPSGLLGGGF